MKFQSTALAASVIITVATTMAFSGSAFRVDDVLFLKAAEQISSAPLDPYGFDINWIGVSTPMSFAALNPPLVSYYIAAVSSVLGWSEAALRLAFLLPSVLCIYAMYLLFGLLFGEKAGGLAALLLSVSPGFVLSGITVMSDMSLTLLWCSACYFWVRGAREDDWRGLMLSAFLLSLAVMTKYFAFACIFLLAAYSLLENRRRPLRLLWLLIPVAVLLLWGLASARLYGMPHFIQAVFFTGNIGHGDILRHAGSALETLAFLGGGCLFAVVLAVELPRRLRIVAALLAFALVVAYSSVAFDGLWLIDRGLRAYEAVLFSALAALGVYVLYITLRHVASNMSAGGALMALWIIGTFAFAAFINWTVSGRNILPLLPPVAGLVANALLERDAFSNHKIKVFCLIAVCLVFSLALLRADSRLADSHRQAAREILDYLSAEEGRIYFQGHWGFQYYMEAGGALPYDMEATDAAEGDLLVVPDRNSHISMPDQRDFVHVRTFSYKPNPWLSTLNSSVAAGYYSTYYGPLPFGLGRVKADDYYIYKKRGGRVL